MVMLMRDLGFAAKDQDRYRQLREQQAAVLKQHQQFGQEIEAKKQLLATKQTDVDIAGRFLKVLDPSLPKSARQFLMSQLGAHVGVDEKSPYLKNLTTMVMGLDPDSLQGMRSAFSSQLQDAPPGQVAEMTRAVLNGDVDVNDLVTQVQAHVRSQPQVELQAPEGTSIAPAGQETVPADFEADQPDMHQEQAATPKPYQPDSGESIRSFEGQRTTPAAAQQASPSLVGALGLDSKQRFRNDDLQRNGFKVPQDPKAQEELATSLNTRSTGISTTLTEAANLVNLFDGRPETLGPVGAVARGLQGTVRQVEGLLNIIKPGTKNESDPEDTYTKYLADRVGKEVAKAHGLDPTAEDSARIQSMVLGLAYRMAIARDIPGNRLTNAIINQHLTQIGNSSSPEQFKATLKDTIGSVIREFDESVRRQTGVNGIDIVTKQLSDADMTRMSKQADLLPVDFAKGLLAEATRRKEGKTQPGIQPASPTLDEEEATLGRLETQRKERELEKFGQERDIAQSREERAIQTERRQQEAADRSEARDERVARQTEESHQLARERFDYQKRQDIGEAFLKFGAAISSAFRGGGIGGVSAGGGGGQDAGAFRLTPTPERRAPPGGK